MALKTKNKTSKKKMPSTCDDEKATTIESKNIWIMKEKH